MVAHHLRKALQIIISGAVSVACASVAQGADYFVTSQISAVEYYGAQMSVFLSGTLIPANSCGARDRFTISPAVIDELTYKAQMSALLTAYASGKTVTLKVSDSACSGDRTSITYLY